MPSATSNDRNNNDRNSNLASSLTGFTVALAVLSLQLLLGAALTQAQSFNVLYNFPEYGDPYGAGPVAALTRDSAGNLYATTVNGGEYQNGTVVELSPSGGGDYNATTLYNFTGGTDGAQPGYGPLIFDSKGNLYGTTTFGGANGYGTVFELTPSDGTWTETVLYSFTGGTYNYDPINGLVIDSSGNLYGTLLNSGGAPPYSGAVFELSPSAGAWTEQLIYTYPQGNYAGLTMDFAGNLYGIGSTLDQPTVYELSLNPEGRWTPTTLYTFGKTKQSYGPQGTLAFDKEGNLYGTNVGTPKTFGSVFELSPPNKRNSKKDWKKKTLYTFQGTSDGAYPFAGPVLDDEANIYGTTVFGGQYTNGTVYELFNYHDGSFGQAVLGDVQNATGEYPYGGVILDSSNNIYGTTTYGGSYNLGIAFELSQ